NRLRIRLRFKISAIAVQIVALRMPAQPAPEPVLDQVPTWARHLIRLQNRFKPLRNRFKSLRMCLDPVRTPWLRRQHFLRGCKLIQSMPAMGCSRGTSRETYIRNSWRRRIGDHGPGTAGLAWASFSNN